MDPESPTLYHNATVLTMDRQQPRAEALLVRNGRVAAVGSREGLLAEAGPGARRVDLQGGAVVPGFNDSHAHILGFGRRLEQVDVSVDAVGSIVDIQRAVRERAEASGPEEWVLGRGYDQNMLRDRRHPTRRDLDEPAMGRPVMLRHTSGHVLTCNSRALQLAGVARDTADPPGGEIDRDEGGEPTGVLKESAMRLIEAAIPPPNREQAADAVIKAMQVLAGYGITSASDASTAPEELEVYGLALRSGELAGRITLMPQIQSVAPPESDESHLPDELTVGDQPDWLRIGATKIFSDGALSTRTAATRQPYRDGGTGILLWEPGVLAGMIRRAHDSGWQIATHAIGDRAIEVVLDGYGAALAASPRPDHRHRIEHCMMPDAALVQRMRDLGVVPDIQPDFYRLGDGYVAGLGLERASQLYPMRLFREIGVPVAFSSDLPVIPGRPLDVIRSAVERRTPSGLTLGPEHAVSVADAVNRYTALAAFATHAEASKGRLAPDLLADFTVLSADPTALPADELGGVRVLLTVAGGRQTYNPESL